MKAQKRHDWVPRKLNELGFVGRGKSRHRPRNAPELYGGPYPFFQTGDIKAAELYLRKYEQTYSDVGLAQSKLWNPGTLCITIAANIADTAILGITGCFPDSVVGFTADPKKADVRFVKYYIDTIKLAMQNVSKGTTQDNLSLDKLLTFDFLAPDVVGQKKIASILSSYDDLIENNTRRIAILEAMAHAIYREWFVEFRFPGHEEAKRVDSPFGKIPEGWRVGTLGEMSKVIPGYAFSSKDWQPKGIPVIKIKNIGTKNDIDTNDVDHVPDELLSPKLSKYVLKSGDLLIAMTGATAGKIGKLRSRDHMLLNQRVAKIEPSEDYRCYIWCEISKKDTQHQFFRLADGAAQPNMSGSQIESFKMVVPPSQVCKLFASVIEPILSLSDNFHFKIDNLRKTRDMLLPKLIAGQLDVEDLDIDAGEPAMDIAV